MDNIQFKNAIGPMKEGFFGKQKIVRYQKPHYISRRINTMMEDLIENDDVSWGKYAFSREPLNGKFNDEQRLELTMKANACGIEYAKKYMEMYREATPENLALKLGIKVHYPPMPQRADRVLFAEYKTPNNIYIYMDSVKKGYNTMNVFNSRDLLGNRLDIIKVLLAHEIFHFIEESNVKTIFTRTQKVELWAPKPFHNRSGINVLGEIAAMAFARELIGLSYSPYVLDVFLVFGYSPEEASGLYEEIMHFAGKTPPILVNNSPSIEEINIRADVV